MDLTDSVATDEPFDWWDDEGPTGERKPGDEDAAACNCFPHGPDEPCTCDGCWACPGHVVGCTCDIAWDCEHRRSS